MRLQSGPRAGRTSDAPVPRPSAPAPLVEPPADSAHRKNIAARLASLFTMERVPYILNGGAALNLIFLGPKGRVPNDIDLRCDDVEKSRAVLSGIYHSIQKPAPVPLYCFVDDNGVEIDLSQNTHDAPVHPYPLLAGGQAITVRSYGFETLFAEKLLALARKKDLKDAFDASACAQLPCSLSKLKRRLTDIGRQDGTDAAMLADSSFSLETDGGMIRTSQGVNPAELLSVVRCFVETVFRAG